jgi:hypothetical protein
LLDARVNLVRKRHPIELIKRGPVETFNDAVPATPGL